MVKGTKEKQFSQKTQMRIWNRDDGMCIFCRQKYHMKNRDPMLYQIRDIMHYIPKSAGGLGIEENGAVGCRYHHGLMDNGNKGLREEMLDKMAAYLKDLYPGWDDIEKTYEKWACTRGIHDRRRPATWCVRICWR